MVVPELIFALPVRYRARTEVPPLSCASQRERTNDVSVTTVSVPCTFQICVGMAPLKTNEPPINSTVDAVTIVDKKEMQLALLAPPRTVKLALWNDRVLFVKSEY